ncbi:hypothetical protein SAMN00768000_3093 [Sulfobacillus thermosulfidooxidans DSM 9293]|uniref:Uncharacterized protein n=1 Tax=Sulfobacillus thermosulfidooxidans (strain DSM 9293 / VKM B-1269 / AT-1) TaxID=929705 RepID=A0A1W1WKZ8_SULTA|nr:hypothetical protein [Sulfobacillus thermosulfidooxidans]SMC06905.1 hypothetical protein SAMN00768000_3093 [Sulfobacillus thermosulfidooxidans DSM 9293]
MLFQFHTGKADKDLETALKAVPPRCRSAFIRQALRWYLLPGGGQEVLQKLEAIESLLQNHRPASPADFSKPSRTPAAQQEQEKANAAAILAAFGGEGGPKDSMA